MATATKVLENVAGHAGPATVYRLDPPRLSAGVEYDHVTIWIDDATRWQAAEVVAIWSTERGAAVGGSIIRRAGSFVLQDDYAGQPEYVSGAHQWALGMLGGYQIVEPEPEPEPQPEDDAA
ncbi:hypothetical protein [Nocardia thailandica]|uniref:hypothetical protein n=1 Tax=Nocardia thailandica TaxID=257275 RepID=UPI000314044C|nr:hypothetical protein [Nocardia thailandica]